MRWMPIGEFSKAPFLFWCVNMTACADVFCLIYRPLLSVWKFLASSKPMRWAACCTNLLTFLGKTFFHLLTFFCKTFFQLVPEAAPVETSCLSNADSATLECNYLSAYVVILGLRDCEFLGLRDTAEWALAHHLTWRRKGNWSPNFFYYKFVFLERCSTRGI